MKKTRTTIFALILLSSCNQDPKTSISEPVHLDTLQGISFSGIALTIKQLDPKADSVRISNYNTAKSNYINNPTADNVIWFGRRTAYLGDYKAAIDVFSEGILKFPDDARFYRHRGHRFISTRH